MIPAGFRVQEASEAVRSGSSILSPSLHRSNSESLTADLMSLPHRPANHRGAPAARPPRGKEAVRGETRRAERSGSCDHNKETRTEEEEEEEEQGRRDGHVRGCNTPTHLHASTCTRAHLTHTANKLLQTGEEEEEEAETAEGQSSTS